MTDERRTPVSAAPADEPTQPIPRTLIDALDHAGGDQAGLSVWTTAQVAPATQRRGKYTPESTAHPAKMLRDVARHAIEHYTKPGELVLDPMCGIGTTLVEAVHLGRRAVGVEYEPHWVAVARSNLELARDQGIDHDARVIQGDARQLVTLLPQQYVGQAALVVTSPPYGPSTHGRVAVAPSEGIQKYWHRYGSALDRGNLANIGHHRLLAGFTRILAGLRTFLLPGGHIVVTIRPWREHSELIDLPAQILACGRAAGLIPAECNVALLARAAETDLVARGSFFQRDFIRKQREAGLPLHLIAHEDVVVFRTAMVNTSVHASRMRSPASRSALPMQHAGPAGEPATDESRAA